MPRSFEQYAAKIGARLRQLRIARGKNMNIANDLRKTYNVKIDPSYLSRMERGKAEPPLRTLIALADYFDIPLTTLLAGVDETERSLQTSFNDFELVELLNHFRTVFGPTKTEKLIKTFLEMILDLEPSAKRKTFRAASTPDEPSET